MPKFQLPKPLAPIGKTILGSNMTGRNWMAHFGVTPEVVNCIAIKVPNLPIADILMALHFLKTYPSENVGSTFWKMHRITYRDKVDNALRILERRLPDVLKI